MSFMDLFRAQPRPQGLAALGQEAPQMNMGLLNFGLGLLSGRNNAEAFGAASQGLSAGMQADEERRRRMIEEQRERDMQEAYAQMSGLSPEMRQLAKADPAIGRAIAGEMVRKQFEDPETLTMGNKRWVKKGGKWTVDFEAPAVPMSEAEQLDLEKKRFEVEQMRRPKPDAKMADFASRKQQALEMGLDPKSEEYLLFVLTEKLPEAKKPSYNPKDMSPEERAALLVKQGMDPKSPEGQQFVVTGDMPRAGSLSATDRRAIMDADEMIAANEGAIRSLERALELNDKANAGFGAGVRTVMGNQLWDWVVPDFVSSPESALAASELENLITTNALGQLKAIFGAAPTEGERKILMDIQGSIARTPAERRVIFENAKAAAIRRLEFNRSQAERLRGGDYYKPGGGPGTPSAAPEDPLGIR